MKLLVVEPHPDDAFLSLGGHLETLWKDHSVTILTVFADDRRAREAAEYAKVVGASSRCLGLAESKMGAVYRRDRLEALREALREPREDGSRIVLPLGLQHPDHRNVASCRKAGDWRYLDIPYSGKQKLGDEVRKRIEGGKVVSYLHPSKRKWRRAALFPSQSKFFYYNPPEAIGGFPEVVIE